jgi:hypothetical protein
MGYQFILIGLNSMEYRLIVIWMESPRLFAGHENQNLPEYLPDLHDQLEPQNQVQPAQDVQVLP